MAEIDGAAKKREQRARHTLLLGFSLVLVGLLASLGTLAFYGPAGRFAIFYGEIFAAGALWYRGDRALEAIHPHLDVRARLALCIPASVRAWAEDPDFSIFFVVFMVAAAALYLRNLGSPGGHWVFDEQEAILANPYVRGAQPWRNAFDRDFWGLLPDRSIGSYRPIPNLLWRGLWRLQDWRNKGGLPSDLPFVWFNIVFHATNAAMLASMVRATTRRIGTAWLAGALFCACAILTEAISGIVGIADVLGGLSLLLALASLWLHPALVLPAVLASTLMGLFSKESAIVNVGLVPLAALVFAPQIAPNKPQRILRAAAAFAGAVLAMVLYFKVRQHTFDKMYLEPYLKDGARKLWAEQLKLSANKFPADSFNNPLSAAKPEEWRLRWAGALRVYFRGLVQVVLPNRLSPDYSTPQEPLPAKAIFPESVLGALFLIVPPLIGVWLCIKGNLPFLKKPLSLEPNEEENRASERSLLGYALIAWPAAFFPLSNIPKPLPTVRAERFWYTPALGVTLALALLILWASRRALAVTALVATSLLSFQLLQARRHANHFRDDLAFWEAAARAVPNSAKAHLNYSVMLGARAVELRKVTYQEAQEARLIENKEAARLWPTWDMAVVYVGDTLCQLNRMDEAWEWYAKGFRLAPANTGLIALGLQCMSDHTAILGKEKEMLALADEPDLRASWLAYLLRDTLERERKCRGVGLEVPTEPPSDAPSELPDPFEDPNAPSESASTFTSAQTSAKASTSTKASASPKSSTSTKASAAGKASVSASGKASTSMSASGSASASAAPEKPAPPPLPPCGVDPKYRPRGLDGGPKAD